jgi:predicted DsbA family dithiol-disulfide isomerase
MTTEPIRIQHFSDILCIWAYVSDVRIQELRRVFADDVVVDYHFVEVFGDTAGRLTQRWQDKGGLAAYSRHVADVGARFEHIDVNPAVWTRNVPASSQACHLFLHAVQLAEGSDALERCAREMREAFFVRAEDVGTRSAQLALAEKLSLPRASVEQALDDGTAMAQLARDGRLAAEHSIKVSPSIVFNEGRQVLRGNVGYRVVEANVRELLDAESARQQHSWC